MPTFGSSKKICDNRLQMSLIDCCQKLKKKKIEKNVNKIGFGNLCFSINAMLILIAYNLHETDLL